MAHGRHGILGQLVRLLVEEEVKQEVEHAHNLLQPMEVLHAREMKVKHSHATPINAKVHIEYRALNIFYLRCISQYHILSMNSITKDSVKQFYISLSRLEFHNRMHRISKELLENIDNFSFT